MTSFRANETPSSTEGNTAHLQVEQQSSSEVSKKADPAPTSSQPSGKDSAPKWVPKFATTPHLYGQSAGASEGGTTQSEGKKTT